MPRILLIDDDASVRHSLRMVLERDGHSIVEAIDGDQGVSLCRRFGFDLVITDLFMPEKDGFEVLLEIGHMPSHPPIITISGAFGERAVEHLRDAEMLGSVRTLAKPFTAAELLAVVREVLDLPQPEAKPKLEGASGADTEGVA